MDTAKLPTLFLPHGAPTLILHPGAVGRALAQVAAGLRRPRAIVIVSAHWETAEPRVGFAQAPETIHDFQGFPPELYAIRYPAPGHRRAAAEVEAALAAGGFSVAADETRGLDHGAWTPLLLMYPQADVPVVPLSIQPRRGPEHHLALGRALAGLAGSDLLVIASGNLTHNLGDYHVAARSGVTPDYVREFADWMWDRLSAMDIAALLDYRRRAPNAQRAHPTDEHLLPLFVALGAAGAAASATRFHAGIDERVLAMDAIAFHPSA